MELIILISISYLFGSIPFGLLLTKLILKKDIREIGSGNIGATNALRTGNKLIGISTLFLDILKAIVPLIYIRLFYSDYIYISSLFIFLGHLFPLWLRFKGGKGVATYLGILFIINFYLALIFLIAWIFFFVFSKYSSLSSLASSFVVPIIDYFYFQNENFYFFIIVFILIFFSHRENIKRLINKTESKTKFY